MNSLEKQKKIKHLVPEWHHKEHRVLQMHPLIGLLRRNTCLSILGYPCLFSIEIFRLIQLVGLLLLSCPLSLIQNYAAVQ